MNNCWIWEERNGTRGAISTPKIISVVKNTRTTEIVFGILFFLKNSIAGRRAATIMYAIKMTRSISFNANKRKSIKRNKIPAINWFFER